MPSFLNFTEAQTRAWDYVRAAVDEGIKATQAYNDYRDAGGSIRRQDFFREYNVIKDYGNQWQNLGLFTKTETIPENMFMEAPRNFNQKYVAEVELAFRNVETNALEHSFRYIESDHRMSQVEIENAVNELGEDYPHGEQWTPEFIYGYKFYKKGA